jgi:phage baseplate assembly protein W
LSAAGSHLAFPFAVGLHGRSATADTLADQVLQELTQLVLTDPGERVFLAEFGGGARRLLFEGIDESTASLAQATLTQAVQNWLGNRATLQQVKVETSASTISITIQYQPVGQTGSVQAVFQRNAL